MGVLERFGFASLGLSMDDFLSPEQVIQLGHAPNRIDLLTSLTGLDADRAWESRCLGELEGVPVLFLGLDALKENKRATGRARDIADLEELGPD